MRVAYLAVLMLVPAIALAAPDPQSSAQLLPVAVAGIDWGEMGPTLVVGGVIGLIVGLVGWSKRRGKQS